MKVIQTNRMESEVINSNHSLSHYLKSLSVGRPATPRSWLYESKSADSVLQAWLAQLESANKKSPFAKEFDQFDRKQIEKFGPQGLVPSFASKEAQEVIEPLFSPSEYDDPQSLAKWHHLTKRFAKEVFGSRILRCRPLRFDSVINDMRARDTLSTNSGYPRFVRRSTVETQEIQDAETGKAYEYPAILLFRQYNGKLRPVWMFPMSLNLIEFSFTQVIQDALLTSEASWVRSYLSPWLGYEETKQTLTEQWRGPIVGGDTTKMDSNMRPAQIELVYECVKWLFQKSIWPSLYKSITRINTIPLLVGPDQKIDQLHGLASGSGWTQLTETVLQLFMAWNKSYTGQGIGDDFYWNCDLDAEQLVAYLADFGLPANPAKQSVAVDHVTFLQRMNRKDFYSREDPRILGGYYPTIRALNSLLNPEKFHKPKQWSKDMFAVRCIMILENCVDDPCFKEFVAFVGKGHSYLREFAKKNSKEIDDIGRRSKSVPGLNPSYNQEKKDKPLSSFVSIQLLRDS